MIQNKYIIGVTGGAGAGKSTVLAYISAFYDVGIIMADETGRELMKPGNRLFYALTEAYGKDIVGEDGKIDTKKLSLTAFKDEESQKKINELEHPVIKEEIIREASESLYDVVFLEAALLIEGGLKELCDEIWLIDAPEDVRIARLQKSRGYSLEKCQNILKLQMSPAEFKKHCTLVIHNGRSTESMKEEVDYYMSSLSADLKKDLRKH